MTDLEGSMARHPAGKRRVSPDVELQALTHTCSAPELRAAVTARVDARLAWITANPACTCDPYDPECPEHGQVAS